MAEGKSAIGSDDALLVHSVAEDLIHLRGWTEVEDDTIRRGSAILRRLINQDDYQKAWRAAELEGGPRVIAPRLEAVLDSAGGQRVRSAIAGGGSYHGARIAMCRQDHAVLVDPNNLPPPNVAGFEAIDFAFGLKKFASSCGIFAEGRRIKRMEVIAYGANKLGGTHFDLDMKTESNKALRAYDQSGIQFFGKALSTWS